MVKKIKNKRGFTLTELIIVIAIIGILSAVLIPSLSGYITKANKSKAEQEASAVKTIYETWLLENDLTAISAAIDENSDGIADMQNDFLTEYEEITGENINTNIKLTSTGFEYIAKDGKWVVTYIKSSSSINAIKK